jgi:hypothetical protein
MGRRKTPRRSSRTKPLQAHEGTYLPERAETIIFGTYLSYVVERTNNHTGIKL